MYELASVRFPLNEHVCVRNYIHLIMYTVSQKKDTPYIYIYIFTKHINRLRKINLFTGTPYRQCAIKPSLRIPPNW